jgi:hypothetical protein
MQSTRHAYAAASVATASYLAATLGLDAARVLSSPLHGLDALARAEPILSIGRVVGFDAGALTTIAVCLGAFELATAGVLLAYLIERLAHDELDQATLQTLEAGLTLVVIHALGALAAGSIRFAVMQLALAGIAGLLVVIERRAAVPGVPDLARPPRLPPGTIHRPRAGSPSSHATRPGPARSLTRRIPAPYQ